MGIENILMIHSDLLGRSDLVFCHAHMDSPYIASMLLRDYRDFERDPVAFLRYESHEAMMADLYPDSESDG